MTDPTAPAILSPQLDPIEARVLGCLIEKALTTPEQYPLTANAATVASNQKTSREPVMELEPGQVGHALRTLEDKKLVRVQFSPRANRYEHRFEEVYTLTPPQRALLCLLLLRGAQTPGELLARSDRLHRFGDLEQVKDALDRLCRRQPALVLRVARQPGQREDRYVHLLCGSVHAERSAAATPRDDARGHPGAGAGDLGERLERLEAEVERLARILRLHRLDDSNEESS
jgi:uncharacterized protein YceH (UPF0502 family)